MTASGTFEW